MLQDLIELYYYIKSLDNIENSINRWRFETCGILHYLELNKVMNPITGYLYFTIKLYVTTDPKENRKSERIRIDPNRVIYEDWPTRTLHTANHEGTLTEENITRLSQCLSTEEVNAIACIYDEINALYNRSRVCFKT